MVYTSGFVVNGGNATLLKDYSVTEEQVQFSPGQSVGFLNVRIHDDYSLEGRESVTISLVEPYELLIDNPAETTIFIDDREDGRFQHMLTSSFIYMRRSDLVLL